MKIRFIANPTGQFNLAYNAGDEVTMDTKQAMTLIEAGVAVEVEQNAKPSKKAKPVNPETELDAE